MKKQIIFCLCLLDFLTFAMRINAQPCTPSIFVNGSVTTVNFNSTGICTWTVPVGSTNLFMETWGAGGSGGGAQGGTASCPKKSGGGGGGAYARSTLNIAPGSVLNIMVGAGGTPVTGSGGASEIYGSSISYVRATGGMPGGSVTASQSCFLLPSGGGGGIVQAGTGFPGGAGQAAQSAASGNGGGCANSGSAGGSGASGGNPGSVVAPSTGGGGSGGGGYYGGGGSGGYSTSSASNYGGYGGDGHVRITYCNSITTPIFNSVSPICVGQTLAPLPTVSTNGISGNWSPALNNFATTTYTFNPSTQCASSTTLTITVNALPTITATSSASAVCSGTSVTLAGVGASTYAWSGGVLNATSFIPTSTATYTVTGTDANGCINTATNTITVNALPTVTATSSASAVCSGTSVTLAGVGASTYAWSGGVLNATSFIPTSTATYTVTGTDANGCINTATKTITVNALPTIQLLASSQLYCTADLSGMLSANPSGGVWSGLGVVGNSFNPFVAGFGLHTILYTYVDANGCSNSDTLLMTVDLCVGINEMTKNKLISVYPNPSRAQINLKVDVTLVGSIYIIYDNTGKIVMSGKINLKNSVIELGNLTAGVYLLNVGKNLKQTIKIIKE